MDESDPVGLTHLLVLFVEVPVTDFHEVDDALDLGVVGQQSTIGDLFAADGTFLFRHSVVSLNTVCAESMHTGLHENRFG